MEYIKLLGSKEQWRHSIELFKLSLRRERPQKGKYNLEETFNDFLKYKNDREHSNTKVAHFRAMINYGNMI